ncbi:MAG: shikimate dehydrogenase [Clostridia bacterium]|nr:shikimate dehydrogenase [Clostridia bacterium]
MEKYALIGHNISYSKSPIIHQTIYTVIGVDGSYDLYSLQPSELGSFCEFAKKELKGFNITKPYKEQILPYLDGYESKSVNTVVNRNGKLYGYSTDGYGFTRDRARHVGKISGKALVLGAGGVSRVIVEELKNLGLTVYIHNRTKEKAESLAKEFNLTAVNAGEVKPDFIVNCTSFGFNAGENPLISNGEFLFDTTNVKWAYDTIYSPPQTEFLRSLQGGKTANGLGMLVLQAVQADRIMCNKQIDEQTEKKIYDLLIKEKKI